MDFEPQTDTEEPSPQPAAAPSKALQDFQGAFTHPDAQDWAGEVTTRLNDYFQRRNLADANAAAGQNFVNDLDQFKGGLVGMVKADPNAVHTALDIVPPTLGALIGSMPNAPEDADTHYTALNDHMQQEIAAAAVTSAAEMHEPTARALLGDQRIQDVLGDEAHGALTNYTNMQAVARARDAEADRGQAQIAQREIADQSARNYISALVDPNNGSARSPAGWNQAVLADSRVPPQDKVALYDIHERLGTRGDVPTDPMAVMDIVHKLAEGTAGQRDLYPLIGSKLSLADAGFLATIAPQRASATDMAIERLDQTIQAAARQFAPNGDVAETRALGRFIRWLVPRVARGGDLDPQSENYVFPQEDQEKFWNNFRMTGDDLLGDTRFMKPTQAFGPEPPGTGDEISRILKGRKGSLTPPVQMPGINPNKDNLEGVYTVPNGSPDYLPESGAPSYNNPLRETRRPSLGQIFAGNGPPVPMTPGANPLLPPRTNEQPIGGTESGGFFQRKIQEGGGAPIPLKG